MISIYIYIYIWQIFQPATFDYPRAAFKTSPESSRNPSRVLSYSHLDFGEGKPVGYDFI